MRDRLALAVTVSTALAGWYVLAVMGRVMMNQLSGV